MDNKVKKFSISTTYDSFVFGLAWSRESISLVLGCIVLRWSINN
jgi:hypothetical protein